LDELYYVYPKYRNMSFSKIAREHIKQISPFVKVQEIDEEVLDNLMWLQPRNILLHPILYATIGDRKELFQVRQKRLRSLLRVRGILGGFETADTDQISRLAIDTLNKIDVIFLPSTYAKRVFQKSGARVPIHVIPHGLSDSLLSESKEITNQKMREIRALKEKNDATLVLFFCLHSEYRKGADLVYDAIDFLQHRYKDLILVVKTASDGGETNKKFMRLRSVQVKGWISEGDLRQLYDVCDMLVVPSRGGGFELNGLEGIARGLPTLVPNDGCFLDYIDYAVPLKVTGHPIIFPNNPIHTGRGFETDVDQLVQGILRVYGNLASHKEKAEEASRTVRERYSWKAVCSNLVTLLKEHRFYR
jgi:glycosyltransferase involved in cell wall biosynthesis